MTITDRRFRTTGSRWLVICTTLQHRPPGPIPESDTAEGPHHRAAIPADRHAIDR